MDVNKVILLGRLTKDPTAKTMPSGQEISLFTVATNYFWTDIKTKEKKESVEFHSVIVWGRTAKVANKYLLKGSQIYLEGRLKTSFWEDKAKQKHYRTEVVADSLSLLGSKKDADKQAEPGREEVTIEEVPVEEN